MEGKVFSSIKTKTLKKKKINKNEARSSISLHIKDGIFLETSMGRRQQKKEANIMLSLLHKGKETPYKVYAFHLN